MKLIGLIIIGLLFHFELSAQWPSYQKPDTITINFNNFDLKDTLLVSGYIAECGEFGGYIDRIKIYKSVDKLFGILNKGKSCNPSLKFSEKYDSYNKTVQLDSLKLISLLEYVKDFSILAITHIDESNAPTEFWISYKYKIYDRYDPVGRWDGFEKVRDLIFKK